MTSILEDLLSGISGNALRDLVREVRIGPFWTAVWARDCGLASTVGPGPHLHGSTFVTDAGNLSGNPAIALAGLSLSESTLEAGIGLAAINALMEVDIEACTSFNAGEYLIEHAAGRTVALVGHFPFVPDLRAAARHLWVIEQHPQPGDLGADAGKERIPEADLLAVTGSALINHSMDGILALRKKGSRVVVLGPTAPLSPVLFDHGVDVICGTVVEDPPLTLRCVAEGATFPQVAGVRLLTMERHAASA